MSGSQIMRLYSGLAQLPVESQVAILASLIHLVTVQGRAHPESLRELNEIMHSLSAHIRHIAMDDRSWPLKSMGESLEERGRIWNQGAVLSRLATQLADHHQMP